MSVIIKGMKKPENCIKCPLQFGGWCYAAPPEIDERVAPTVDEAAEQGRPEWCPLVEIPYGEYGRGIDLIDANELTDKMYHEAFEIDNEEQKWESGCWIRYKLFERILDDMPRILKE